jgi:nitrogen-specific signal transduction histidine kinase/CheY-like chemotaxis protein
VREAAGAITGYVAVKRDITRDLALEAQFLQAQKMQGIGRLAGGVAHDFNNLLSVILSHTEFLLDSVAELDPLREDVVEIERAGKRAAGLTRQLLAFSRKQVLAPEVLDLNHILGDMEKMLRRIIGEDVALSQELAPDLGLVKADPGQIEQVVMNLVVNARDAMAGGGALVIRTRNRDLGEEESRRADVAPGRYVEVEIADTGVGMDAQTLGRIFEPFFTTKPVGKGTGLGLATVYGIARQSGGGILVDSEIGKGTAFHILLPRDLSEAAPAARAAPAPRTAAGPATILVVEDEEPLRRVAVRILEKAGYTVLAAGDGAEAARLAAECGEIDLLLTDVIMPQMSGRALAEGLMRERPGLRVLYMSGYTDDAIVHHGVLEPGTHFLSKPFTQEGLLEKVRDVLDGA